MANILIKRTPVKGKDKVEVNKTLKAVPRNQATVEVEGKEQILADMTFDGFPGLYEAVGNSHKNGGIPLNLPEHSFIFSKDKSMKLKDEKLQSEFNKPVKKSGYTPAEIAKKYDINKYRKVLADPASDKLQRETAEDMIKNYNEKLGKLALAQESLKGLPDGVPFVSMPYLEEMGIDPARFVGSNNPQEAEVSSTPLNQQKFGGATVRINALPKFAIGGGEGEGEGSNPAKSQTTGSFKDVYNTLEKDYLANPKLQEAVYAQYKKEHPNTKYSAAQVNNYLITAQRHNYLLQDKYKSNPDELRSNDWNDATSSRYEKEVKSLNQRPLTSEQRKISQGAYRAFVGLESNPEFSDFFNRYGSAQFGEKKAAHQLSGKPISKEDAMFGTTSTGQLIYPKTQAETPIAAPTNTVAPKHPLDELVKPTLSYEQPTQNNPFWTQDLVNMYGAFNDLTNIKKYMPWQSGYSTQVPNGVYYDPTRELAANSEQANISETALANFAGPQALSARMSSVQGKALENAANILGKYNNLNVGEANQIEANRVNILNIDSQHRGDLATSLYDKTVVTNQNFDNAKRMARERFRQSINTGLTNRGKTQALNAVNKQYRVDATTGFVNPTGVPGTIKPPGIHKTVEDHFNTLMENPNLKSQPEIAFKLATKMAGINSDDDNVYQQYLRDYNQSLSQ